MRQPIFDLQGHRGARGLKPENTLSGFETAFDVGVTTVETDVHLTSDGVPVLLHDPLVTPRLCRLRPGCAAPDPAERPAVSRLTLTQLRCYRADRNPYPARFPGQDDSVTPLVCLFAEEHSLDPWTPPALADLFAFAEAYAGEPGRRAGKTESQRGRAREVRFDLELKRVPANPAAIGDDFDGVSPGLLERAVVEAVRRAGVLSRTVVRSFDHRSVRAVKQLEPTLTTAVLVAGTAPVDPPDLARKAGARIYCPDVEFLDELQVRAAAAQGVQVIPWTVNDADSWLRLLAWGVDGITTDFPDRLAALLQARGIPF